MLLRKGKIKIGIWLLVLLVPLNAYSWGENSKLLKAAGEGDTAKVQAWLDKGANVNAKDKKGGTALMWAASRYLPHPTIVQALLDKGADVNAKGKDGRTALMVAAMAGHPTTVQALLDKGANVNAKKNNGDTALALAGKKKHTKVVELLKLWGSGSIPRS